jgi:3-oxoadipate enol-lactonase
MPEQLYYEEIGEGIPLICLHGYALDHSIWLQVAGLLKSSTRFILPDLRGHGKSPAPEGNYSMEDMAEDVLLILDDLNLKQAFIAGHSMGGYIALALAEKNPERVLGLALVASHTFADTPEKKKSRLFDIEKVKNSSPAEVLKDFPGKLSKIAEVADYCKRLISQTSSNGVIGVLAGMAQRPDRTEVLVSLNKPTILIAGCDDQLIPMEIFLEMSAKIKNIQMNEINNVGHMPMMEDPNQTAIALKKFIQ